MSPTPPAPFPSFTKIWHTATYPSIPPSNPTLSASNKTIIITGAGTGIGAQAIRSFAAAGASFIGILGRTSAHLHSVKNVVEKDFPRVKICILVADITQKYEIDNAFFELTAFAGGGIHVLVNNAGYGERDPLIKDADPDAWMTAMEVNVRGSLIVAGAFVRSAAEEAVVINITSFISYKPIAGYSSYAASKAAAVVLFDMLQMQNPDLRVVNMHPGIVDTGMTRRAGGAGQDDVSLSADFMVWLASPEAAFTKGKYVWANWDVDELKARANEISGSNLLKMTLEGWEGQINSDC
ncbi:Short chain dehydrogenase [Lachnellula subtilissima]|uniref:Short chain dehydrogenase n=1 Tax=Lachnellula subtilissima TaxID=602034 RepID=A0A8H8RFE6_9HELO|nr:Short chain dehydrogenase [Lachnellula subtilissima]